jgi:hypothetical protein
MTSTILTFLHLTRMLNKGIYFHCLCYEGLERCQDGEYIGRRPRAISFHIPFLIILAALLNKLAFIQYIYDSSSAFDLFYAIHKS